jgi:DNA-directed RNA polymerase subunit L
MTDLTNVQFNHTFLATLSLTIHIKNISTIQVYYIHYYVTHGFFQRNKITIELVASNQEKKLALVVVDQTRVVA